MPAFIITYGDPDGGRGRGRRSSGEQTVKGAQDRMDDNTHGGRRGGRCFCEQLTREKSNDF